MVVSVVHELIFQTDRKWLECGWRYSFGVCPYVQAFADIKTALALAEFDPETGVAALRRLAVSSRVESGYRHPLEKIVSEHAIMCVGRLQRTGRPDPEGPPSSAEFLFFLFYDRKSAESLTGDLLEGFHNLNRKFGYRKAWFWYWWQTLGSICPIIWAWAGGRFMAVRKPLIGVIAWMVAKNWVSADPWGAVVADLLKRVRG